MRALLFSLLLVGCTSSSKPAPSDLATAPSVDLATNPDLGPTCGEHPMTHVELLNACTNADSVDKTPFYPALAPNGQLPPLP